MNLYHYFECACRRPRPSPPGLAGGRCSDDSGNSAVFWFEISRDVVASADYRCTTCFTLVALCEHLRQSLIGISIEDAAAFSAVRLLSLHPEIPPERRGRAALAAAAAGSALEKQTERIGVFV